MVETHTQELGSNKDPKMGMDLVGGKGEWQQRTKN